MNKKSLYYKFLLCLIHFFQMNLGKEDCEDINYNNYNCNNLQEDLITEPKINNLDNISDRFYSVDLEDKCYNKNNLNSNIIYNY